MDLIASAARILYSLLYVPSIGRTRDVAISEVKTCKALETGLPMNILVLVRTMICLAAAQAAFAQGTFTSVDIGARTPAGQTVEANGGFDISSATGDVWGTADDFRFVYRQVSGDFDMRTRIASFTGIGYWAKAGLMVRADTSDFAANGFMVATRSLGWGRYMFTGRLSAGFNSYVYSQGSFERVQYPDVWVRVARVGSLVIPMHSTNGIHWTQVGNVSYSQLPRSVLVGMAVSNHPDAGTSKATAQFRDVAFDVGTPVAPVIVTEPESQTVNPGDAVFFSVTAVGRGTLNYQWFHNGTEIPGSANAFHVLSSAQPSDAGKFTCRVSNEFGEVHSWAGSLEIKEANRPFNGILLERYNRVYGRRIEYLLNATNFPASPSSTNQPTLFEASSLAEDAGARISGYVTAPVTGDYTFYIAADDRGELWLSHDDNPANKFWIAECYYWVAPRDWDDYFAQTSDPIRLEVGQRYYLEALIKGEGSPNHGSVGWRLPTGVFERPIPVTRFLGQAATLETSLLTSLAGIELRVTGTTNSPYVLQSSTNLVDWTSIQTNRAPFNYSVPIRPSELLQFYRVVSTR
jgi:hypothetical protein